MHEQSNEQDSRTIVPQEITEVLGRDENAIANLVGFFDVLIQMDIEHIRKERTTDELRNISAAATRSTEGSEQRSPLTGRKTRNSNGKATED